MQISKAIDNLLCTMPSQVFVKPLSQFAIAFSNRATWHILQESAELVKQCYRAKVEITYMLKYFSVCS